MLTQYGTTCYFSIARYIPGMKHDELWFVKSMRFAVYVAEWELLAGPNVLSSTAAKAA